MLCHFESVALSDGTSVCSGISLPCSDYVETQYEIRFDDNLPDLFTKELFDLYANGLATSAAAVSGYNITVVPDSGSFSENIYSMTLREPIHGSIAEFMCGFYQSGTYYPGHYACHIRAVYADKKAYCKKMELCPASFTSNSDKKDEGGNSNTNASSTQAPFASFVLTMLSFALLITLF